LAVNYGGSTGFGRNYRQRLNDNWGVVDVADCVNGAKYLVEQSWLMLSAWQYPAVVRWFIQLCAH